MTDWDPEQYAENARHVAELGVPLLTLLNPGNGERILDLGCGDGALTQKLHDFGCEVTGIDASAEMVAAAQELNLTALTIDAQQLPFTEEFDAVFTNAALHWMKDHDAVVSGVWRALKPGGRFVGEFGGEGNVQKIVSAISSALARRNITVESPWNFPAAEKFHSQLESAGFTVNNIELFPRPTPLPSDLATWLRMFAQNFLAAVPENDRPAFIDDVSGELRPALCDKQGNWTIDHVRLRFSASKPINVNAAPG